MSKRLWVLLCAVGVFIAAAMTPRSARAQVCSGIISSTVGKSGDPTQTGRFTRGNPISTCAAAQPAQNLIGGTYSYNVYNFTNTSAATACFTITLTWGATTALQMAAYSTFDPANITANHLGNSGTASGGAVGPAVMGINVAAGATIQVVVTASAAGSMIPYTLAVSAPTGAGCFTSVATLTSSVNPSVAGQATTLSCTVSGAAATPTGTVTFFDGANALGGAVTLDGSGLATLSQAFTPGPHSLTAVYSGDATYLTTTSAAVSQTTNQAATTTTVSSSDNPQALGGAVTFTANVAVVSPGAGSPTGTVSFFDGASLIGTGTVASGQATVTTSGLTFGNHDITAVYGGDADFTGSTSSAITEAIGLATSTVVVAATPTSSVFGSPVRFDATVTSTGGTPTGTVTFLVDGATVLGPPATLDGSGLASLTTSVLPGGDHTITAQYGGDDARAPASGALPFHVDPVATQTALTSSANPSVFGQTVTLTASVASNVGTPMGSVVFKNGGTTLLSVLLDGTGHATLSVSSLLVGTASFTAEYSGAPNFAGSVSGALSQEVDQATTTTTVSSSSNPTGPGSTVTFTVTVAANSPGGGVPTGTVTLMDGATALGSAQALSAGTARFTADNLSVGGHAITAVYAGDANFATSTSAVLTEDVNATAATVVLAATPTTSVYGQDVTLTATVSANTGGTPTGTVTFKEGTTSLGTATLDGSGVGTLVIRTLDASATPHTVTATYGGDGNHTGGSAADATITIDARGTSTTLAADPNPSSSGGAVTLTATVVASASPAVGGASGDLAALSGNVTFKDGQTTLGTAPLSNGAATFSTSALTAGSHSLTASYEGTTDYATSDATAVTQVVNAPLPEAGVDASPNDAGADVVTIDVTTTPDAGAPDAGVDVTSPQQDATFIDAVTPPQQDASVDAVVFQEAGGSTGSGGSTGTTGGGTTAGTTGGTIGGTTGSATGGTTGTATPDAGAVADARADSAIPRTDAATSRDGAADGGSEEGTTDGSGAGDDSGCSCRVGQRPMSSDALWGVGVLGALLVIRRRKRRAA